jgi:hypothetical protein
VYGCAHRYIRVQDAPNTRSMKLGAVPDVAAAAICREVTRTESRQSAGHSSNSPSESECQSKMCWAPARLDGRLNGLPSHAAAF